jgi:hypothetical protein
MLCIEKAASGQSLIQVLRKEAKIPVEEMKPLKSKSIRLQAVCPLMEQDRVFLVEGYWLEPFIKELTSFPYVRHDDSTDAFTWALTFYALRLDHVDKGLNEAIIMNKRFKGELIRPGFNDSSVFVETATRTGKRGLFGEDTSYNNPDYERVDNGGGDTRSDFLRGGRRGGRGVIGYD